MNAKRLMYRLQTALCARGQRVKINQRQYWNEDAERMLTRYIVQIDGKKKPLVETNRPHEVVQALAEMLVGGGKE